MPGPFAVHVEGFRQALAGLGYSPRTARDHGYVLAQLSRWLVAEHLSPEQLTEPVLHRFVRARRLKGYRRWRSRRSLRLMVSYLRAEGAIPVAGPAEPDDPLRMLLGGYRRYLVAVVGPGSMSPVSFLRRVSLVLDLIWRAWRLRT